MGYEKIVVSAPTYIKFKSTSAASGGPTLFAAINKRIVVTVSASKKEEVSPHTFTKQINSIITFLNSQIPQDTTFSLVVSGTYPKELGSHTSLAVVAIGAIVYFKKHLWNPHEINKLAYEYLKRKRMASGGEVTAATFGGFIWERRELSFLNSIWQLPIKITSEIDHFYLARSNSFHSLSFPRKRESKKILDQVKKDKENNEKVVKQLAEALKKGDDGWLRQYLPAVSVGEKLSVCYDLDTSKHSDGTFEKIHFGDEGVRIEQKG